MTTSAIEGVRGHKPSATKSEELDRQGFLLLALVIGFGLFLPLSVPTAFFFQIDPFYYVFEEFLPNIYSRPNGWILLTPPVRLVLIWICATKGIRLICVFCFTNLLGTWAAISSAKLMQKIKDERRCLLLYVKFRLITAKLGWVINGSVLILLMFGHLGMVTLLWLVFKCWDLLPTYFILTMGLAALLLIAFIRSVIMGKAEIWVETGKLIGGKTEKYFCSDSRAGGIHI